MPTYPRTNSDAIIVGAGPAGSATALLLARHGLDVTLLDRRSFPRAKPCGDCLSAAATDLLRRLGVLEAVLATGPARLRGWTITSPAGAAFTGRFPGSSGSGRPTAEETSGGAARALAVERAVLDRVLVEAARDAGARFRQVHVTDLVRDGATVGVLGREEGRPVTFRGRLVVGADGLRSTIAARLDAVRRPSRLDKVSLTTHVEGSNLTADPELGEMHLVDGACLGIAPVNTAASRWNVTLVVTDPDRSLRTEGVGPFFARWVERFRYARPAVRGAGAGIFLASGPFDRPVSAPVADGVALIGDAAGYYDPFTGQGVYRALASAEALARVVAPALARGVAMMDAGVLAPYVAARRRLVAGPTRLQKLIEAVLARPWLADAAIRRIGRAGGAANALIAVTGDLRRPASLLHPRVVLNLIAPSLQGDP